MDLPNEIWYKTFSFLPQRSKGVFSNIWNLHNFSAEEIELLKTSNNLWFDTAKNGYIKLMKFLIKEGTDIHIKNKNDHTALHVSSWYGHKDCAEFLIKSGAVVNAQTNSGFTPLHNASMRGHKDCVEILIKAGVGVNIQDEGGRTALNEARMYGHKEIVELLIKAGGFMMNIPNNYG